MAYFAMGHTDLKADLSGITGWTKSKDYSSSMKRLPGEVGSIEEFRVILTAMFEPWDTAGASGTTYLSGGVEVSSAASCDVYPLICVARDSYAIVPLQGYNSVDIGVVNPGKKTKDDPLGQIGFVSWGTYQAGAILNQSWCARLEASATASPS